MTTSLSPLRLWELVCCYCPIEQKFVSSFPKPLQRFRDNLELKMGIGVYSGHASRRELSAFSFLRVCAFIVYLWRACFRCTPWQALTFVMFWNASAFVDRWFILLKISSRQENLHMTTAVLLALLLMYRGLLLHWWASSISYLPFGDRIAADSSLDPLDHTIILGRKIYISIPLPAWEACTAWLVLCRLVVVFLCSMTSTINWM